MLYLKWWFLGFKCIFCFLFRIFIWVSVIYFDILFFLVDFFEYDVINSLIVVFDYMVYLFEVM